MSAESKVMTKKYQYTMLILVMVIFIVGFAYAATALAALWGHIAADLGFDLVQISALVSALPLGVILFSFIGGALLDRLSTRVMLFISLIVCGIGIFLRGTVDSFGAFYASMMLLGIGQAVLIPGITRVVANTFPREVIFKFNGILMSAVPIGMWTGFNTSIPIAEAIGWQNLFMGIGILGWIVAVIWVLIARDFKKEDVLLNKQINVDLEKTSFFQNIKEVLSKKQNWFIILAEGFSQGSMQTLIALGPTILVTFPGTTPVLAAFASSMGNLGSLVGYYVLPPISEKFGLRKPFIIVGYVINVLFVVAAYMVGNIWFAMFGYFVGFFVNGWTMPGPRTMLQESPGVAGLRAGTAMGVLITVSRIGAMVVPLLFAAIAGVAGMIVGISIVAGLCLFGAVFIGLAKETGIGREAANKLQEEKKAAKKA